MGKDDDAGVFCSKKKPLGIELKNSSSAKLKYNNLRKQQRYWPDVFGRSFALLKYFSSFFKRCPIKSEFPVVESSVRYLTL